MSYPTIQDDIFKSRFFARRITDISLAAYTGSPNLGTAPSADTVDIMLDTNDVYIISRSLEVVTSGSEKVSTRFLSFPQHNNDGTPVIHVSQTLTPIGQLGVSKSVSQINPTLTSVGFVGDPFNVRAVGTGSRQLASASGQLGLLYPNLTISLRIQNLHNQPCEIDTYFFFSEIASLSGSRGEP